MPNIDDYLRRLEDEEWVGRERELLDLAKKCLADAEYEAFEDSVQRGYTTQDVFNTHTSAWAAYKMWCITLKRPFIEIRSEGSLEVFCPWLEKPQTSFGQVQAETLKREGWYGAENDPVHMHLYEIKGGAEAVRKIEVALNILNVHFHQGLPPNPPAKTRYERLMGEDDDSPV